MQFEKLELQIKKMDHFKGDLPIYETPGSSGFDIRAQLEQDIILQPGERALIPTGLSFAIPEGFELQSRPRSGLALRHGISMVNTPGTIDSDYRGEVKFILINHGEEPFPIRNHERIGQLVLCPVYHANFKLVEELNGTQRGEGGFGSTSEGA